MGDRPPGWACSPCPRFQASLDVGQAPLGPVQCPTSHPGHQWKGSRGLWGLLQRFLASLSPGANKRAGSSSSSAVGEGACTSLTFVVTSAYKDHFRTHLGPLHIVSLPLLLPCWPEALPGVQLGAGDLTPLCSVSWLCSHPFPTVAPVNIPPGNKSPDVDACSSLAAFMPLKTCHSLHWVNFHGNMSKTIQSLNMVCDECRIIVSGSSTIGADGGSDNQPRAVSRGAPADMSAPCLASLSVKADRRAALSTTELCSVQDPPSLSMRDQAQSMAICQCGQATWTSSCQTCIVSLRMRFCPTVTVNSLGKLVTASWALPASS